MRIDYSSLYVNTVLYETLKDHAEFYLIAPPCSPPLAVVLCWLLYVVVVEAGGAFK